MNPDAPIYRWKLYSEVDAEWLAERHMLYMDKVGWQFIDEMITEEKMYQLYRDIYLNYLKDDPSLNIFQRSQSLNAGAHVTMIYLGLKYNMPDIQEIIDLTLENKSGSLYIDRTLELRDHFAKIK